MINKKPDPILLTQEALDKAKTDQVKFLKLQEEILIRLQAAREMGDLSENGAYKYAKFELGNVRRELGRVNRLVRYGEVIVVKRDGKVDLGNKVKLRSETQEIEFLVVGDQESDPLKQKLSVQSPFGKAVLGKRQGDTVQVDAPAGVKEYLIVSVE